MSTTQLTTRAFDITGSAGKALSGALREVLREALSDTRRRNERKNMKAAKVTRTALAEEKNNTYFGFFIDVFWLQDKVPLPFGFWNVVVFGCFKANLCLVLRS